MKKKLLALVLVVALAVTTIIGGTLAYQVDTESAVNVAVVGNVDVELIEQQREQAGSTSDPDAEPTLVDFKDGKILMPHNFNVGDGEFAYAQGPNAFYADKIVRVENTGDQPAYVRVIVAIPAELENSGAMHWEKGDAFSDNEYVKQFGEELTKVENAVIEGVEYNLYVFTREKPLAAQEMSAAVMSGFYLDSAVDYNDETDQWTLVGMDAVVKQVIDYDLSDGIIIPVFLQAVQSAGFDSAKEAFDASFTEINKDNHPWVNGFIGMPWDGETVDTSWYDPEKDTFVLTTPEQLAGFAKLVNDGIDDFESKTVALGADIDLANGAWTPIGLVANNDEKFKGTFDGMGYTISNLNVATEPGKTAAGLFGVLNGTAKNFTIENAVIDHISTGGANGVAVVAGSIFNTGLIDKVHVVNATVNGNHYVGGIAGHAYGIVTNCNVTDSELTATPNAVSDVSDDQAAAVALLAVASEDDEGGPSYDNGDKVGGIVGLFPGDNYTGVVKGNTVSDTTLTGYRDVGGIAGYAANVAQVTDNRVEDITLVIDKTYNNALGMKGYTEDSQHDIRAIIGDSEKKTVDPSNVVYVNGVALKPEDKIEVDSQQTVADAEGLVAALENGDSVVLTEDVKIDPAGMSNAYGKTGINVKNGQTVDGGGNTLDIKGAGGTWDSGINTTGGLIKNITVTGSFRGIFINHSNDHTEPVVLENVIIDGTTYTISCDQGSNQGLTATNCTFNGWTSYAATLGEASFTDCSFGEGNGYAYCRPYAPTTFVGCAFEAGYQMDARAAVTFENCTLGGVALTAENLSALVTSNIANATVK